MTDNDIIKAFNIDEAIKHCYEVAEQMCNECGKEHLQLAEWLEELKTSRETINRQKAEIKRLLQKMQQPQDCEFMDSCSVPCEVMKRIVETEIDKLNAEKNDVMYHKAQIKAEAITEFEQRLNDTKFKQGNDYVIYADNVSTIAKEMKGKQ